MLGFLRQTSLRRLAIALLLVYGDFMFGTIIIDTYKKDETYEITDAIDDICCANDNYGWSSAGIYCFWNYYTREVFYSVSHTCEVQCNSSASIIKITNETSFN